MTTKRVTAPARPKLAGSVLELVGGTPLVRLNRIPKPGGAIVLAKLESLNPGGSVKDRIALAMVEDAERRGVLKAGATLVEPTSGNTGIGLAMVCAVRGYRLILTMPDDMSAERQRLLARFGAEIHLTPAIEGMTGAVFAAQEICREHPAYFMPMQFENPANPEAHRRTTALEILEATEERLDVFVAAVGTGGTVTGVGEVLKERVPGVRVVGGGAGAIAGAFRRPLPPARHPGHRRVVRAGDPQSFRARRHHTGARRGRDHDGAAARPRGGPAGGHLLRGQRVRGLPGRGDAARGPGRGHGAVRYWRALSERHLLGERP